ncbi:HPP family protein [Vibrio rumoiensis]|uniref:HPP family protein n=1 Tax=Vibrio rumoiensis 1S-45 TaxID=1188252 RepID=A0A1E5E483_9VIBR|nr:HPP family protein [Vibrio rumoiensis]OEF27541.1 HPP family protein [Vibrio rumoiensis 1S-45]
MNKDIQHAILAGLGATITIGLLSLLDTWNLSSTNTGLWLMAPFGATTVLVFGVSSSPLAQPKNVIFGHLLSAFVGLFFAYFIGVQPWALAGATGIAITLMLATKTTHPPAGANPILIMLTGQTWGFLLTPVLLGSVAIVLCGLVFNHVKQKRLISTSA